MNNIKKCEIATYPISFKANITKTVLNNLSNNSSIDKTLKLASASALAYWTALVSTKNNTENIDRIGSGIDNIYIKNMSKEKRSWKKEMEPLEEFTKEEYEI